MGKNAVKLSKKDFIAAKVDWQKISVYELLSLLTDIDELRIKYGKFIIIVAKDRGV
ncbi:MAG: hypothetical protein QXP04_03915 [Candidatus Nanoarchaeia archaeon]|nr:hypothetical protein [Candidatus Jingweiarchaeum tengchongense]